jgi:hypothetical protein
MIMMTMIMLMAKIVKDTFAYRRIMNLLKTLYVCIPYFYTGIPFHSS